MAERGAREMANPAPKRTTTTPGLASSPRRVRILTPMQRSANPGQVTEEGGRYDFIKVISLSDTEEVTGPKTSREARVKPSCREGTRRQPKYLVNTVYNGRNLFLHQKRSSYNGGSLQSFQTV